MKIRMIALGIALAGTAAHASDYWLVAVPTSIETSPSSQMFYVDNDTLKINGSQRTFWKTVANVGVMSKGVAWAIIKEEVDCTAETISYSSFTAYDRNGGVITTTSGYTPAEPIIPNSLDWGVEQFVCRSGDADPAKIAFAHVPAGEDVYAYSADFWRRMHAKRQHGH